MRIQEVLPDLMVEEEEEEEEAGRRSRSALFKTSTQPQEGWEFMNDSRN